MHRLLITTIHLSNRFALIIDSTCCFQIKKFFSCNFAVTIKVRLTGGVTGGGTTPLFARGLEAMVEDLQTLNTII